MEGILGRIIATLMGLLALGAVVYIGDEAMIDYKSQNLVGDIGQVVANTRSGFANNPNLYSNFGMWNLSSLIGAGIFPSEMVRVTTSIVDPFGDWIAIQPVGVNSSQFQITIGGSAMPVEACAKVMIGLTGYASITNNTTTFRRRIRRIWQAQRLGVLAMIERSRLCISKWKEKKEEFDS